MMRLFSQVKFCFQECQFHPEVTCAILCVNETQKSSLPRIFIVNVWVLQKVLARLTLIFHISGGFQALSLAELGRWESVSVPFPALLFWGAKPVPLGSSAKVKPGSGTEAGALLAPSLDLVHFDSPSTPEHFRGLWQQLVILHWWSVGSALANLAGQSGCTSGFGGSLSVITNPCLWLLPTDRELSPSSIFGLISLARGTT